MGKAKETKQRDKRESEPTCPSKSGRNDKPDSSNVVESGVLGLEVRVWLRGLLALASSLTN